MPTHSQYFNGSSQWLSHADHADFDITGDITVEAWVKFAALPSSSAEATIVSKYNDSTNQRQWRAAVYNNAGTYVGRFVTSSTGSNFDEGAVNFLVAPTADVWYHLAWAKTGTTYTFYVNGKAQGTDTVHSSQFSGSANLTIGAYDDGSTRSNYFNGFVKYVRIFDDLRTAAEIASDAAAETVSNANLKAEWAFDGALTDSSGNSHTLTANGSPVYSVDIPWVAPTGVESTEYVLDLERGSSQYAAITDASQSGLDITGALTLEAWIMLESLPSSGQYHSIISKGTIFGITDTNSQYLFYYDNDSGYRFGFLVRSTGANCSVAVSRTLKTGVWYHVAAVYTPSTSLKIYLDGVEIGSQTSSVPASLVNTARDVRVGDGDNAGATSMLFDGLIKQARIFSEARTQAEIVADALASTVSDANLEAEWSFNNVYTDASGGGNTLTSSGSPSFRKWGNDLAGALVSWWTLDETSSTRDDAHAANDLTDNNTVLSATGKKSNGADFEAGSSEYLSIAHASQTNLDLQASSGFSISAWLKLESLASTLGYSQIVMGKDATSTNGWHIRQNSGDSKLEWVRHDATAPLATTTALSTATWYHVVFTYDGTTLSVYVNGILEATASYTLHTTSTAQFEMGRAPSETARYFDGVIDEVGVWARALTYGEVLDLYNEGAAITYTGSTSVTIGASAQALTLSVPTYTPKHGSSVAVATQVVTASIPAYTVSLPKIFAAAVQVLTLSIPTYIAGGNKIVTVATQALTLTVPTYSILKSWIQAVSTQVVTLSTVAVSIVQGTGVTVLAATQSITASIPTYTVILVRNVTVLVSTVALTLTTVTLAKVGAIWRKVSRNSTGDWTRQSRNSN